MGFEGRSIWFVIGHGQIYVSMEKSDWEDIFSQHCCAAGAWGGGRLATNIAALVWGMMNKKF
ncbi:MAG: hypothetical protein B7X68_12630 [Sphingobacteriia bacterium 39-36-14]|nr:MAG: hypothetical protein B7X68_12630 [Sphingobacteriia bacterium 39-36-14]